MTLKIGGLVDIIHAFDTESTSLAAIISLDVWKMRNSHYISVKSKVWQISAAEQAIQICNLSNSLQESFCKPPLPHHQKKSKVLQVLYCQQVTPVKVTAGFAMSIK